MDKNINHIENFFKYKRKINKLKHLKSLKVYLYLI